MREFLHATLNNSFVFMVLISSLVLIYVLSAVITIEYMARIKEEKPSDEDKNEILLQNGTDIPTQYYKYLREEIKREDEITHQRLTWSITFQGFIINALAVLLVFSWDMGQATFVIRKFALVAVGIIGLHVGILSLMGILASRNSIRMAKNAWEYRNEIWKIYPHHVPQTYGQNNAFHGGSWYSENIPRLFVVMWLLFILGYTNITYYYEVFPCLNSSDFAKCFYENRLAAK